MLIVIMICDGTEIVLTFSNFSNKYKGRLPPLLVAIPLDHWLSLELPL
jgi:hypothetical protein